MFHHPPRATSRFSDSTLGTRGRCPRPRRPVPLSDDEIAWLRKAGADLRSVWSAESTSHRERKQLVRRLVKDVVVTVDLECAVAEFTIVWAGGTATRLTSKLNRTGEHHRITAAQILDLVRRLAPDYSNEQIACILNRKHLRTGQDNAFTALRVKHPRNRLGIPTPKAAATFKRADRSWMVVPKAAAELDVSVDTIRRSAREYSCRAIKTCRMRRGRSRSRNPHLSGVSGAASLYKCVGKDFSLPTTLNIRLPRHRHD